MADQGRAAAEVATKSYASIGGSLLAGDHDDPFADDKAIMTTTFEEQPQQQQQPALRFSSEADHDQISIWSLTNGCNVGGNVEQPCLGDYIMTQEWLAMQDPRCTFSVPQVTHLLYRLAKEMGIAVEPFYDNMVMDYDAQIAQLNRGRAQHEEASGQYHVELLRLRSELGDAHALLQE